MSEADSESASGEVLPLTVLTITYNEAERLPGLLDCVVGWAEDVFVVDSGSTDRTVDICLDYGVSVVQRRFTSFSDQWNFAAKALPITTPWSMKLDPDERVDADLKAEIGEAVQGGSGKQYDGFVLFRRLWFMGQPLHVTTDGTLRIWRTGKADFGTVRVNEHAHVPGHCERITHPIRHLDSPHLHHWCEKQNLNTTLEADRLHRDGDFAVEPKLFGDRLQRRMWLKQHEFRLPFRYVLRWLYLWILKGAWRDGELGRAWVTLRVGVMRLIELKSREMASVGTYGDAVTEERETRFDPRVASSAIQKQLEPEPPSGTCPERDG